MARPRTTAAAFAIADRRARALELRRGGATFADIAATPGPDGRPLYATRQSCQRAVATELRALTGTPGRELRDLELGRLESLHQSVWPDTLPTREVTCDGCGATVWRTPNLTAISTVLRLMERRADLLGLDFADGLAEREVAVLETQVALMDAALRVAMERSGLPAEQQRAVVLHMAERLREIGTTPDSDPDDDPDDPDAELVTTGGDRMSRAG